MSPLALVTGGSGWLGQRLLLALTRGLPDLPELAAAQGDLRIRCLLPASEEPATLRACHPGIEVQRGDLRDPEALAAFCAGAAGATLFHCAGLIHPTRRTRELFEVNVSGTRRLLEAAEAAEVARAVVVSSNSPLGANPSRSHRFDERSPYAPYMSYGRSKMEMEREALAVHARGRLAVVLVRAPWFYGPGQPARQTTFFTMIRKGTVPIVGDGQNLRSMAYVDNLCQGLLLCGRRPQAAGEIYWIADRRPYSMNEIVDTIERLMAEEFGRRVAGRRLRLPGLVADLARIADGAIQAGGFYHQRLHVLSEMNQTIACSIAKAETSLGYDPRVELEEGMRRSLAWCVEQGIEF